MTDAMKQLTSKIFYLKKKIIFPYCSLAVFIKSTTDSKEIQKGDRILAYTIRSVLDLACHRNRIATLCEVADVQIENTAVKILLKGIARVRLARIIKYKQAEYSPPVDNRIELHESVLEDLRKVSQELVFLINVDESDKLIKMLNYIVDLNQMTDFISHYFIMDFWKRIRLYNEPDIKKRSVMLKATLAELIDAMNKKRKKETL